MNVFNFGLIFLYFGDISRLDRQCGIKFDLNLIKIKKTIKKQAAQKGKVIFTVHFYFLVLKVCVFLLKGKKSVNIKNGSLKSTKKNPKKFVKKG